jgi:hypothetical protein
MQELPVVAVPITNDVSNEDMAVTEVMKVMLPDSTGWEGMVVDAKPNSSSKKGWETVTRRGRKSIPTGQYNPLTGKTVTWNVTATEVDLDIEKVSQAGYYNIFNITDQDEITHALVHHKMCFKVGNVGAGVGGGFVNTQELQVITYNEAINGHDGERWKAEVENKYQQMVNCKVFEPVLIADLPPGTKIIDSVWTMKKEEQRYPAQ